jgi:hypothetical protein
LNIASLAQRSAYTLSGTLDRLYCSTGWKELSLDIRNIQSAGKTDRLEALVDPAWLSLETCDMKQAEHTGMINACHQAPLLLERCKLA